LTLNPASQASERPSWQRRRRYQRKWNRAGPASRRRPTPMPSRRGSRGPQRALHRHPQGAAALETHPHRRAERRAPG